MELDMVLEQMLVIQMMLIGDRMLLNQWHSARLVSLMAQIILGFASNVFVWYVVVAVVDVGVDGIGWMGLLVDWWWHCSLMEQWFSVWKEWFFQHPLQKHNTVWYLDQWHSVNLVSLIGTNDPRLRLRSFVDVVIHHKNNLIRYEQQHKQTMYEYNLHPFFANYTTNQHTQTLFNMLDLLFPASLSYTLLVGLFISNILRDAGKSYVYGLGSASTK